MGVTTVAERARTAAVLNEISEERSTHASRGFDNNHDDARGGVHRLVELADNCAHRGDTGYYERGNLVKAASLIVAAIELLDRSDRRR